MPLNIAGNNAKTKSSIGPGVLYVGASGTTPTVASGLIGEDGASLEISAEVLDIMQGVPKIPEFSFFQSMGVMLGITSIEWDLTRIAYAIGAGNTTVSGSLETLAIGGEPCVTEVAVLVQHRKCTAVHTVNLRLWKATSADGSLSATLNTGGAHAFPMKWKGLRSATNWAGDSLPSDEQLFQIAIDIT